MRTLLRVSILGAILTFTYVSAEAKTAKGAPDPPAGVVSGNCIDCHADVATAGHPLAPNRGPACLDCHRNPAETDRHGETGEGTELRAPARTLCANCHGGVSSRYGRLGHALLLGRVHGLDPEELQGERSGLGPVSRACMGCHDGATASAAAVREFGASRGPSRNWDREHPIGMDYSNSGSLEARSTLRPRATLPAGIRLESGSVGCISCHSPYSKEAAMLAVPGPTSNLCLACHIK